MSQTADRVLDGDTHRRIYLASSWRNAIQPLLVATLRDAGHEVYDFRHPAPGNEGFRWSDIDPDWLNWSPAAYAAAVHHPIADAGYAADRGGMDWADTCVLLLPCGRSAHAEAGFMAGAGKPVHVYIPDRIGFEPELMYRLFDGIHTSLSSLLGALDRDDARRDREIAARLGERQP